MNLSKGRYIGLLHLLIFIFGILSVVYVIEKPDYLKHIYGHEINVYSGAFFQLLMVLTYGLITYYVYPILRSFNLSLSNQYLGFRMINLAFHLIGIVLLLLFVFLSRIYQIGINTTYLEILGEFLRHLRDLLNHVGTMLAYITGSTIMNMILYQYKLVPRWICIMGYVGCALTLISTLLFMFNLIPLVSPLYMALNAPLATQELIFALYLITKGFNVNLPDN